MSVLSIIEFPDSRLRIKASPVTRFDSELDQLVHNMYQTMYSAQGVGLAATQVNVPQQVLVIDMSENRSEALTLVNARIAQREGTQVYKEGCLSFPGMYAQVTRALKVKVEACDTRGKSFVYQAEGPLAVAIQHEMDHLEGKVFIDYLSPLKRAMLLKRMEKQRKASA